jgi:hypothetical protein
MKLLSSHEAAAELGVTVSYWHTLVAKHDLQPVKKLAGLRGASLWDSADIERIKSDRGAA